MGRGSSKAGGTTIESFESQIYKSDSEKALIIMPNGKSVTFGGDESHVFGSREDIAKMNGATATHNHPNDAIFSDTDVSNGIAAGNLKEMRIVTKSGETHSIKNNGASLDQRRAFSAQYRNQTMKAQNNINAKQRRGENVNPESYTKSFMEKWLTEHAEEYNLKYKKGKISKK